MRITEEKVGNFGSFARKLGIGIPAIKTRHERAIISGLERAGLRLLHTQLNHRQAYQAMFLHGSTLDELDTSEVNGIAEAQRNALSLASELIEVLAPEPANVLECV